MIFLAYLQHSQMLSKFQFQELGSTNIYFFFNSGLRVVSQGVYGNKLILYSSWPTLSHFWSCFWKTNSLCIFALSSLRNSVIKAVNQTYFSFENFYNNKNTTGQNTIEGCTVEYSLTTREIVRAEPEGFPEGSGYISPYIRTWVIIQTFSISKSYTSSIGLPGRAILKELILGVGLAAGAIFSHIAL